MGEIMKRGIYLSILLVVSSVLVVDAATTSNLAILGVYEDRFANYDFDSKEYSPNNVDWPVTMVFWKNADVNKVKSIFFGQTILAWSKYGRLNDSDGWIWDEDRGTKGGPYNVNINGTNFTVYLHMRIYAPNPPDYMNNSGWGRYVLATTHYDEYPWEGWSGYSELAEKDFADIAASKGYTVARDWAYFYNYEPYDDTRNPDHIWLNNGYATAVMVE